jgi:hypothetical protein
MDVEDVRLNRAELKEAYQVREKLEQLKFATQRESVTTY